MPRASAQNPGEWCITSKALKLTPHPADIRSEEDRHMLPWLDAVAAWLAGLGIHPVLGAFVTGVLAGLVVRPRHAAVDGTGRPGLLTSSTVTLEHGSGSLSVNGTTVPLESSVLAAVVETIRSGHTIDAIKLVREKTGLGLAESKLLVETVSKSALLR